MPNATREQIAAAFFDLVAGAADLTATSRRFVHWDQVNETRSYRRRLFFVELSLLEFAVTQIFRGDPGTSTICS